MRDESNGHLCPLVRLLTTTDNVCKSMPLTLLNIHLTKLNKKTLIWLTWSQLQLTWGTALKPINVLMTRCEITKTGTLAMNFHKFVGEANPYVLLVYNPVTIFYHTWGQVSGKINSDQIHMIHTGQQSKNQARRENFKDNLYRAKKSFQVNKSEHPAVTLYVTFQKPVE